MQSAVQKFRIWLRKIFLFFLPIAFLLYAIYRSDLNRNSTTSPWSEINGTYLLFFFISFLSHQPFTWKKAPLFFDWKSTRLSFFTSFLHVSICSFLLDSLFFSCSDRIRQIPRTRRTRPEISEREITRARQKLSDLNRNRREVTPTRRDATSHQLAVLLPLCNEIQSLPTGRPSFKQFQKKTNLPIYANLQIDLQLHEPRSDQPGALIPR